MLKRLELENVGPASRMELNLAPRLNLVTGDNGLGKSFLLDVAWWALTRKWPRDLNPRLMSGYQARPTDIGSPACLRFTVEAVTGSKSYQSKYSPPDESWAGSPGRPLNPGLVVHAHVDGGFSVWDPARNYWRRKGNIDVQDRLHDDERVLRQRREWYRMFQDGEVSLEGLRKKAPLIAMAVTRAGRS